MGQTQPQINSVVQSPAPPSGPQFLAEKPTEDYFTRLFSGRLNRQNFIVGSAFFVIVPVICFMIVLFTIVQTESLSDMSYLDSTNLSSIVTPQVSIVSLLTTPANEVWVAIGIIFVILSLPYLLSLQIRRLHDLNINGWLWIINFLPLLFLKQLASPDELLHPDVLFLIGILVSLATILFSFYVSLWPGTNGPNKYGEKPPPRSSFLGDILELK